MIKSIVLKNFRGFRDHTVDFTPFCLLIGQNNAGKTTLIEALRIASTALQRVASARFEMAPNDIASEVTGSVFRFSVDTLDIEHRGIHYNYEIADPAIIRIRYNNNCSLVIAIGETISDIYCQLLLPGGNKVTSRAQAVPTRFHPIFVMPPVGALLSEETHRDRKYLYKNINGYLSYRHLRNQMFAMPEKFERFREFLTRTWSTNLQVGNIEFGLGEHQNHYGLTIRDGPFVSEMALVGSGLQAWIQTVWFLARVDPNSIVVLDEPDVYLHADLQRKLVKLLAVEDYRQTIVATHSLEMIADVSPNEIVAATKRAPRSRPLSSSAQAQGVVDAIGTNLNIQLSKLANAGRVIFVEGKDYVFLDQIAFKKGNAFYDRFGKLPHFGVGGMNNWPKAAMAAKAFFETSAGKVGSTMLIDRDYKDDAVLNKVIEEASKDHLCVYVWKRKEIENYLLSRRLIFSYVQNRARENVTEQDIDDVFSLTIDSMMSELPELVADSYQAADRKLALPTAMAAAKAYIKHRVDAGAAPAELICGKRAISEISKACQERWNVSISAMSLCRHMTLSEVPQELSDLVESFVA